ncbi:hypothetical protein [Mobilicoccus caccae]|nr:hypothetical protein [Mobilicoccus caccae]
MRVRWFHGEVGGDDQDNPRLCVTADVSLKTPRPTGGEPAGATREPERAARPGLRALVRRFPIRRVHIDRSTIDRARYFAGRIGRSVHRHLPRR